MMSVNIQGRGQQDSGENCDVNISVPLDIAYGLDINPMVKVGNVKSHPCKRRVCRKKDGTYVMFQLICVEIPLDINFEIECSNNFSNNE